MPDDALQTGARIGMPGGMIAACCVAFALLVIVVLGLREHRSLGDARRRALLDGLRVLTALAAGCLVIQPEWLTQRVEHLQGRIAVLLDTSRSMSVREDGHTRLSRASELAAQLYDAASHKPALFGFGAEVAPLSRGALDSPQTLPLSDDTRIEHAVRTLATGSDTDLGALLVISDGADLSASLSPQALSALGVHVHTVVLGDDHPKNDVAISALHADPVAFLRQPAQVEVTLRAPLGHPSPIPVTLRKGRDVVRELDAELGADGSATITLPFTPEALGRAVYTVSVPVEDGDAVPENNERSFLVRVTRERLRVLLVCGAPSWDARFLRGLLKANPSIDLITFFILRTQNDNSMAAPEELSLIPFPTEELFQEHLDSFDLVMFQNFDFGPYQMARYLPRIHDYVMNGGSFAMLGGERSFGAGGYIGTPIESILPVTLVAGEHAIDQNDFSPALAADTGHHPVVELLPREGDNAATWKSLAPLVGNNLVSGLRAGAQALLVHPSLTGDNGEPMPVLAVGTAGKGRTLALTSDTSYRWSITTAGRTGDASIYERFWDRALRWLSRDPTLEAAQVTTERERYGPGSALRVSLWLRDARYRPLGSALFRVSIEDEHGQAQAEAAIETDAAGKAQLPLSAPREPGAYSVVVRAEGGGDELAREVFVVEAGGDELQDPRARPELLQQIARATSGSFYAKPSDVPALDSLPSTRTRVLGVAVYSPFASAWFFALFVGLFSVEWWLRRRFGLK